MVCAVGIARLNSSVMASAPAAGVAANMPIPELPPLPDTLPVPLLVFTTTALAAAARCVRGGLLLPVDRAGRAVGGADSRAPGGRPGARAPAPRGRTRLRLARRRARALLAGHPDAVRRGRGARRDHHGDDRGG